MSAVAEIREQIRSRLFATPCGVPNDIRNASFFRGFGRSKAKH